ncbi:hypothetical protein TNCT_230462 [Trichonephila clavata]|uniref:UV excision repair protein RAD23 n=1 Tax=Trichonephila clavata TaxID=2740835 RepID=A0A8X6JGW3_TRICU|nr:hypothetical protein TNCT_230462 [Trichonephila clavata]
MLITLKTLQEDSFTVEADPLQTVKHLKESIERVKGDAYPAKYIKLLYGGKFLVDGKRLCDYNLEEKKFVILVVKRPQRSADKEQGRARPFPSTVSEREQLLYEEHDQLVEHIVELGFRREEVERALGASFNNAEQAVEYLINGTLSNAGSSLPPDFPAEFSAAFCAYESANAEERSERGASGHRESILPSQERIYELFTEAFIECRNHTRQQDRQIEADHELISQNYAELEAAGITDPHGIFETLNSTNFSGCGIPTEMFTHPDGVFQVFNETYGPAAQARRMPGSMTGGLLDRDHQALERLKQFGFADQQVVEAYFICDRNENAAADFLFSQNDMLRR